MVIIFVLFRLECYVEVNVYCVVVLWEVVLFSCFFFFIFVVYGFKFYIVFGKYVFIIEFF